MTHSETRARAEARALYHRMSAPQWQPIETAPKMKTLLLFAVTDIDEAGAVKNWKMATGFWHTGHEAWEWEGNILAAWEVAPTHWQPLPAPPALPLADEIPPAPTDRSTPR